LRCKTRGGRKPTHLTSTNIRINIHNICIDPFSLGEKYGCSYKNTDVSMVVFHPL
jgi:hypothetical protein